jgi:hypothetical protein
MQKTLNYKGLIDKKTWGEIEEFESLMINYG